MIRHERILVFLRSFGNLENEFSVQAIMGEKRDQQKHIYDMLLT